MVRAFPVKVMKTDFWRYAVLYEYGGIYADLDIEPKRPIEEWNFKVSDPGKQVYLALEPSY